MKGSGKSLWIERGGSGSAPTLILIHGLWANAAVWDPLLPLVERDWSGPYLIPDLRGHGRSPHLANYSFGTFAADIAEAVDRGRPSAVIGHSLGGVVGALLGTDWFGVGVRMVLALSVRTRWSPEEASKVRALADRPVRWMHGRQEAQQRYLRVSGLEGIVRPDARPVTVGIRQEPGRGFRFASDPRVVLSTSTTDRVDTLLRAARCPVHFAAGSEDAMVTMEQMTPFDPGAVLLPGTGHNPHVQAPEKVWSLFKRKWQAQGAAG